MSPLPRPIVVRAISVATALSLAAVLAACGGDDPVAEALQQQTVTVQLPTTGTPSTAPAQQAAPSGAAGAADAEAETDAPATAVEPPAGGNEPAAAAAPGGAQPAAEASPPSRTAAAAAAPQQTVHLKRSTALRDAPGGRVIGRLRPRTEFDSPTVLAIVRQRDGWLGVLTPQLPNGRIGWISARATLESHRSGYRIDASLSRREVVVRRNGRVVQRFPVAIGSEGTPTPTGRFAVTDKLLTQSSSSPYGCCILALSGHQTATPQGWGGGDRIAIHATNLPETIGTRASLGCLRAPTEAIRRAVNTVPLGTIVTIRA
ncbi:L,D-transpeptidase [Conexibacter stalactiti]|uniref:L,D-transpeptidase n=1 Tax=Conexibacter stalactiti TaxID=1940611 RepID=A0ABU4HLM5_9ACTN|nr:L,D-transpeptidase [Conexibacter stalactiti]MDW5594208.1 L,D-transpeptidase [Conexibacter stalactiti]MEC5034850.1 L,D-transpeptidase [Conexibacter stalactiti]